MSDSCRVAEGEHRFAYAGPTLNIENTKGSDRVAGQRESGAASRRFHAGDNILLLIIFARAR